MRVLASFVLLASAWAVCPVLKCSSDLAQGVCARYVNDSVVEISGSICQNNTYCTVLDFEDWLETANSASVLECTETSYYTLDYSSQTVNCPSRESNKNLESGSYPKKCEDYGIYTSDCATEDGETGYCECGFNGKGYCQPDLSSDVYDDYWSECSDNNGNLDSSEHAAFWYLKYSFYVKYISAYSCAHDIFHEFREQDRYDYIGDAALWLLAPLALSFLA